MDQCRRCSARGDIGQCLETPCSVRESWFATIILETNKSLVMEIESLKSNGAIPSPYAIPNHGGETE